MRNYSELVKYLMDLSLADRNRNIQNANTTEDSLCGQLMLISTVFLTVGIVTLAGRDSLVLLSTFGKITLILGLALVLASMGAGVRYYFKNVAYYQDWAKAHNKDYEMFLNNNYRNLQEASKIQESHHEGLSSYSNDGWLKVQIWLLTYAGAAFLILAVSVLFDFGLR